MIIHAFIHSLTTITVNFTYGTIPYRSSMVLPYHQTMALPIFALSQSPLPSRAVRCFPLFARQTLPNRSFSTTTTTSTSSLDKPSRWIISWWVPVLGGLGMTCAGGLAYFYNQVGSFEGLRRTIYFYSFAIPKYVEYRYHLWKHSPQHVWDELDRTTSATALQKILALQGFYIKCGQMVASNVGDAFPLIWQDTMSVLQDQVPAQPFHVVKGIVASELDFDATFSSFETTPIGAASIGQGKCAVLCSTVPCCST